MDLLGYTAFVLMVAGSTAGAALLAFGLRGRKVDDFPYCRRCRYNLTGLTSERCPECGGLVAEVGTIIGKRRRRPRLILAGLVLSLPSAAALIGAQTRWARSIEWYQKLPTWWVIREARSTSESRALRACEELVRRDRLGLLAPADQQARTDAMLVQFERRTSPFEPSSKLEDTASIWLDAALKKDSLTPAQRTRLYDRLAWVTWRARPVSSLEVGIPVELRTAAYFCGLDELSVELVADQVSMNIDNGGPIILLDKRTQMRYSTQGGDLDLPKPFGDSRHLPGGYGLIGWVPPTLFWAYGRFWTVAVSRPGIYEFRLTYTYSVLQRGAGKSKTPEIPLYQQTRTIVTRSQVVATPPGQLIKTVEGSRIKQEMLARMAVESVYREHWYDPRPEAHGMRKEDRNKNDESPCIHVDILANGSLPVGAAFQTVVEGAGDRADRARNDDDVGPTFENEIIAAGAVPSSSHPHRSDDESWWFTFWDDHPGRQTVNIVLTPDVRLAARSVDVTTICGETLRFENVPVDTDSQAANRRLDEKRARETAEQEAAAEQPVDTEASQPAE
jgi:hypothetical protein